MKKSKRLDLISIIVKENDIHSKAEIVDLINDYFGIKYSVSTISKDLDELNIYKMPTVNNDRCYQKVEANVQHEAKSKLKQFYEEEIEKVTIKENYLIIKASPGFAQSINFFIDLMHLDEILGTIAGNDTILILSKSAEYAHFVHYKLFNHTYIAS
ncbi:arginine repressor [Staphylococcus auricularis]|uniref:arginine repressor n=1 Tax=Staphylococcus auricularis TaxID=29379 RepID=UPI003EBE7716